MPRDPRSALQRYGFAVIITVLFVLLRFLLQPLLGDFVPFILFYPALILSAWYGGLGPGLLSTFLSAFAALYFFIEPNSPALINRQTNFSLVIFIAVGSFICWLSSSLRSEQMRASLLAEEHKEAGEANAQLLSEIENERARLNAIVKSVPGVVWEAWGQPDEASQRMNFVSDYVEKMLGYSVEEWLQTPNFWLTIVHEDDKEQAAQVAAATFTSGEKGTNQFRWVTKDGRVLWVEAQSVAICDEQGKPIGMRGVTIDIDEKKRGEQERNQLIEKERAARIEAEESNQIKDEFLATVSHELRTPLTAILGWILLLRTGKLDAESAAQALSVIERNARSQQQIIEDLLDVSRIVSGKLRLNVRECELVSVVEAAVDAVRLAAEARQIELRTSVDPSQHLVLGDPDRLQQVVWNILSNAVKFTPQGGRVNVQLTQEHSHAQIKVSDTGPGIKPDFKPFIFERFRQGDSSTTRLHGGLGLGLAIVRHLVELHGGTVSVENDDAGHGAVFTVSIPLVQRVSESDAAIAAELAEGERAVECPPLLNDIRVLLVDDDADTLAMLDRLIAQCGAEIITARSAAEALNIIESSKVDVLVSDIGMPEEDGYTLIRKVREMEQERGGRLPAVALTAYAMAEDRLRALSSGFQAHVSKPIEPNELLMVLASLVDRLHHAGTPDGVAASE
ncbi:MAG: ATP-binding protein [Pyrinomonadaceae bacterium]